MRLVFWLSLVGLTGPQALATDVYFTPSPECEERISAMIRNSQTEIVAAVYSINNEAIVAALLDAHRRGVKLRILTDSLQAAGRSSQVLKLDAAGVNVRLHSKHKIEHNKFAAFDGRTAVTGSFNWTRPASEENSENCVFLNEAPVVKAYRDRFETLWGLNTAAKSEAKFERLRGKISKRTPATAGRSRRR